MIIRFKLFESPNGLKIDNSFYSWSVDTYAFGYYEEFNYGHFLIGKEINHRSLAKRYFKDNDINLDPDNGRFLLYCGRIFLKPKVITFWRYPETKEILNKIREDIYKAIKIEIDDTWRIEIIDFTKEELALIDSEGWWQGNGTDKIIPINDYIGSRNRSEEEMRQQHILSPIDKKKEKPKGWRAKGIKYRLPGEPDIVAKRRLKYMYQENMITNFKLFENPNAIYYNGKDIEWDTLDETYPFSYDENDNLEFGEMQQTHGSLDSYRGKNSGRLFMDYKILTFWQFPESNEELKKVVKDIENELDIEIWNDDEWRVEILTDNKDQEKANWGSWNPSGDKNTKLIPLRDYKSSKKRSEEELKMQHILSPLDKRKEKPKGWKSKGIKYKLPGETEIEAKRRLKYLYQESQELKGKMINVDYKIFHQDWKEKPLALVTDFKIKKIEDNWIEVISKGYEYVNLSKEFNLRKKKGWIPYDDFEKGKIRRFPKKSVKDGVKRIKVYFSNLSENMEDVDYIKQTKVRCNQCYWTGTEDDLDVKMEDGVGVPVCPNCITDDYLMDLDSIDDPKLLDYISKTEPKEGIKQEDYNHPIEYIKAAYPEYFMYKKYNL